MDEGHPDLCIILGVGNNMNILKSAALAAALLAAPIAASAATVTVGGSDSQFGNTNVSTAVVENGTFAGSTSITFSFTKAEAAAYQDFSTNGTTTINLVDYIPDYLNVQSKFAIYRNGTAITSGVNCGSTFAGTNTNSCTAVTGVDGKPGVQGAPLVFSNLAAGDYRIAFYNNVRPETGGAQFIVSAVPLPAGGLLLLSAFGAAAAMRRRKKADA